MERIAVYLSCLIGLLGGSAIGFCLVDSQTYSIKGNKMKTEREAFEESNNIKPDWSFKFDDELQQYVELDHEMQAQVEEFNEHWDTFRTAWQAAKAQTVPEGFVLVPKEPLLRMIESASLLYSVKTL